MERSRQGPWYFFVKKKKKIGIPNCTANGFAEMELGRESRRSRC
jgi:hypothetical protein